MKDQKDYKILIADDEPDILEFVTYNLIKEGYQVSTARNGMEAVEKRPRKYNLTLFCSIL
ncbi:hypothetical protein OP864_00855 [Saprospira grandis]|nr:hypothetical protein [Saprospira grandis]WBM74791.1 hypothetical protein OP864_00855 [Saprospira grandis]